jgi:hypothetical protein
MQTRAHYPSVVIPSLLALPLLSCGGSGNPSSSGTITNPSPVQAQTSYSAASLSGTYTVAMAAGDDAAIVSPVTFIGSLTFDGNGNITAGTINGLRQPTAPAALQELRLAVR